MAKKNTIPKSVPLRVLTHQQQQQESLAQLKKRYKLIGEMLDYLTNAGGLRFAKDGSDHLYAFDTLEKYSYSTLLGILLCREYHRVLPIDPLPETVST